LKLKANKSHSHSHFPLAPSSCMSGIVFKMQRVMCRKSHNFTHPAHITSYGPDRFRFGRNVEKIIANKHVYFEFVINLALTKWQRHFWRNKAFNSLSEIDLQRSSKVIKGHAVRYVTYDFLLVFHSNFLHFLNISSRPLIQLLDRNRFLFIPVLKLPRRLLSVCANWQGYSWTTIDERLCFGFAISFYNMDSSAFLDELTPKSGEDLEFLPLI